MDEMFIKLCICWHINAWLSSDQTMEKKFPHYSNNVRVSGVDHMKFGFSFFFFWSMYWEWDLSSLLCFKLDVFYHGFFSDYD